jgi:hypothetical protein
MAEYLAVGKQLLRDAGRGLEHFGDMASPEIANALADVLNGQVFLNVGAERANEVAGVLWP